MTIACNNVIQYVWVELDSNLIELNSIPSHSSLLLSFHYFDFAMHATDFEDAFPTKVYKLPQHNNITSLITHSLLMPINWKKILVDTPYKHMCALHSTLIIYAQSWPIHLSKQLVDGLSATSSLTIPLPPHTCCSSSLPFQQPSISSMQHKSKKCYVLFSLSLSLSLSLSQDPSLFLSSPISVSLSLTHRISEGSWPWTEVWDPWACGRKHGHKVVIARVDGWGQSSSRSCLTVSWEKRSAAGREESKIYIVGIFGSSWSRKNRGSWISRSPNMLLCTWRGHSNRVSPIPTSIMYVLVLWMLWRREREREKAQSLLLSQASQPASQLKNNVVSVAIFDVLKRCLSLFVFSPTLFFQECLPHGLGLFVEICHGFVSPLDIIGSVCLRIYLSIQGCNGGEKNLVWK